MDAPQRQYARSISVAIAPVLTFVLGLAAQKVFEESLSDFSSQATALLAVFVCLIGLIGIVVSHDVWARGQSKSLRSESLKQATLVREVLSAVRDDKSLNVQYVDDGDLGASYSYSAELIKAARESITIVDFWEPFVEYQAEPEGQPTRRSAARLSYYEAILETVRANPGRSSTVVHRRIVQLPEDLLADIPFEVDPLFHRYLREVALIQSRSPSTCRIRIAPTHIRLHFVIVDRTFVIIPILSHDPLSGKQQRHGALIFEDHLGDLFNCMRDIYSAVDAKSQALSLERLTTEEG